MLVSEEDGVVTGYASFGDWRSFDGFRHTVEHSVYVHPDHQGKGLGRKLLSRLIDEARDCGKHVMVAGIESQNQASLHLHHSLGFVVTAQMPQVGTKFGRWLDLTFMQLQLDERTEPDAIG